MSEIEWDEFDRQAEREDLALYQTKKEFNIPRPKPKKFLKQMVRGTAAAKERIRLLETPIHVDSESAREQSLQRLLSKWQRTR